MAAGLTSWLIAAGLALTGRATFFTRIILGIGGVVLLVLVVTTLPEGSASVHTPLGSGVSGSDFRLSPDALWLLGFGLPGAIFAAGLGTPARHQATWSFGVAMSLIGALGVFGLQDAVSFLVAWEIMSLGGAVMILGEDLAPEKGRPVLFMPGIT